MSIRFINTTTKLPVDGKLETSFLKAVRLPYREAAESAKRKTCIDVFFVNEVDFELERKSAELVDEDIQGDTSMDLLGVYFSHHADFNRPIIKVSPEKVMAACLSFKGKNSGALPLVHLYPALLVAVVIHEIAHMIMDDSSDKGHDVIPWTWLVDRLEEDPQYNFLNRQHIISAPNLHPAWRPLRRFIEESLANAFVLKQKFSSDELDFLKAFIATQPQGYQHGELWSGNLGSLFKVAKSWARFKRDGDAPRWNFIFSDPDNPVKQIANTLCKGESVSSVNFENAFYQYLASRADYWQRQYDADKHTWNERLNGTFGVLATLSTWGCFHSIKASHCLKFLKQWAANGSPEAVDKLHKTLAETLKSKRQYAEALRHQRDRLHHLPKLKLNEYWHKRYEEEIQDSISELDALRSL